jgi:hypothetical protein
MTNTTNTISAPTYAVDVDDWEEVNGEVCRYVHEADHLILHVPGAFYGRTARQLPDGSVVDREMYVHIPHAVLSEAAVQSIIASLSAGLADMLSEAPGDGPTPRPRGDARATMAALRRRAR